MRSSIGQATWNSGDVADHGGEHAAEDGDVELGRVGKMLEDGARRNAGHLGDVAHDRRHFAGQGQGQGRGDDGFARAGHAIAAAGMLQLLLVSESFNVHYTDLPGQTVTTR